jgi:hypothetical protein
MKEIKRHPMKEVKRHPKKEFKAKILGHLQPNPPY